MNELVPVGYAQVNITYNGQNGDMEDPVSFESSPADVLAMAQETLRAGGVRGIDADPTADLTDFIVKPYVAHDGLPNRFVLRPPTPFGDIALRMPRGPVVRRKGTESILPPLKGKRKRR